MPVTAKLRHLRIAPRKVRLVADQIRGKKVEEAQTILNFISKRAAQPLLKLLNSAVAGARHDFQLDPANLYLSKITVDEGPKYKRWRARARGRASEIQKKTSHVTLVLDEVIKRPKKIKQVKRVRPQAVKEEKTEEKTGPKEKPKFKPMADMPKPKTEKGIKRIFKRKAF